ncbi:MAG: AbrB/MazE/SpoVT family DNA-binding domain-containing protein [Candidatus Sulfotelmatobacter sp.]
MSSAPEVFRIRVAARRQVTLPEELMRLLRIDEGDTLEISVEKNAISGGYGLKLAPTSLFDDDLIARLHERENQIEQGLSVRGRDKEELAAKLSVAVA